MTDAARQIQLLRQHRVKPERNTSITSLISATANNAQKTHKKLGQMIDLWENLVPATIAASTAITALRGGTLYVAVADAATHYELDRLLREGLEQMLRAGYRGSLMRVRLKVSPEQVAQVPEIR